MSLPRTPLFLRLFAPILLLCLLLLGIPPAAHAGGEPSIALGDIELLPVHEIEWALLLREHPDLVKRLMVLGGRLKKIHGHLQARSDPTDAGSQMLQQQIGRLAGELSPHLEELRLAIEPLGIDRGVLEILEAAPAGPLRKVRHAVRIVARVPDLPPSAQMLYAHLAPAVDASLLTLYTTRERLQEEDDVPVRLDVEMLDVQKRFWRVVDSTLDRDQRRWVRRRLPGDVAKLADFFGHLYTLPELEVSQASRLKALLVRIDAEVAPDKTTKARAEARLAEKGLSSRERASLEKQKQEAEARTVALFLEAWTEGLAILTEDQRRELDAILPLLTPQDRPGDLKVLLEEIALTAEQHPLLADLHRRYGPVKGLLAQELAKVALMERKYGPDAPQRETMEVMKAQAFAGALVEARKAARELFLDVLTPDQVTSWVLGVPKAAHDG